MTENNPKTILITGCSSGIGYDAAHQLHKLKWRVFATCRKPEDCERLMSEGLESFVLDYEDEESIKTAVAETLHRSDGSLDALFNNGAYAVPGFTQDLPRNALRAIFEANLFGYFDLINQLLPVMLKQGHGKIINCSSVLGLAALRGRGAYNATKFAMEGLTDTLRLELIKQPVDIILIEPGPIKTNIRQNGQVQFEKWLDWENSLARKFYEKQLMPRLYDKNQSPDKWELPASAVTDKLIMALNSSNPKPRYYVTTPTYIIGFLKRILPTRALDKLLSRI
ncbi:MAG: NAD(P)-dependent dehydrogenase (short-subunit alcohol dehydrogenase family) [Gammaproteobacteria bacterium]|jgi:NAD(P)-dependent dehydrogenase (short-subunit alcohol dehydrogenase family)